jgi:tRNA A-37 threonylcarbamoyl transferase component Bud32
MKYAVEMALGAMTYIQSFINIGIVIQKLIREDTQHGDLTSLLLLLQNE